MLGGRSARRGADRTPLVPHARQMVSFGQDVRLEGLQTRVGMARVKALPRLRCSDEALMPLVGFTAQQVRQGRCPRGATRRQGERLPGPICPATLANTLVKWHVLDLEVVCHGRLRAVAKAGGFGAQVTGLAEGSERETTAQAPGWGQVPRPVRRLETRGWRHEIAVTVYGGTVFLLLEVAPKMPLAVPVGQMQAHEVLGTRALVTQARLHGLGAAKVEILAKRA